MEHELERENDGGAVVIPSVLADEAEDGEVR
jgi:hypothetical protein